MYVYITEYNSILQAKLGWLMFYRWILLDQFDYGN